MNFISRNMLFKMFMSNASSFMNMLIFTFLFVIIFYFWFKLITVENMVLILSDKLKKQNINKNIVNDNNIPNANSFNIEDMIMKNVFCCSGDDNNNCCKLNLEPEVSFENNDEPEISKIEVFDLKKEENIEQDSEAKSEISNNIPSKKNLSKLNLEGLKDKCSSLNLSADGTKAQLIERILNMS